jgi:hypothetical protein
MYRTLRRRLATIVREALAHDRADVLALRFPGPAETY